MSNPYFNRLMHVKSEYLSMKKIVMVLAMVLIGLQSQAWGITGHRTVGLVASEHLNHCAIKFIKQGWQPGL